MGKEILVGLNQKKPLWTCPKCGAKFVSRNMWHSCGPWTVEKFLEGKGARAKQLFNSFVKLVQQCGPFQFAPSKTEIALMVRVRFAQVKRVSDKGMACSFWLKHRIQNPRFTRVEKIPPNNWIYTFHVTTPEQLDSEVLKWVCIAYKVGQQMPQEKTK